VDVVYFEDDNLDSAEEKCLEKKLLDLQPDVPWSVKNEARMHIRNDMEPYTSTLDAVAKFPETATSIAVRLNLNKELILRAPHGICDLMNLEVRPTPFFTVSRERMKIYHQRLEKKKWKQHWHKLHYFYT